MNLISGKNITIIQLTNHLCKHHWFNKAVAQDGSSACSSNEINKNSLLLLKVISLITCTLSLGQAGGKQADLGGFHIVSSLCYTSRETKSEMRTKYIFTVCYFTYIWSLYQSLSHTALCSATRRSLIYCLTESEFKLLTHTYFWFIWREYALNYRSKSIEHQMRSLLWQTPSSISSSCVCVCMYLCAHTCMHMSM